MLDGDAIIRWVLGTCFVTIMVTVTCIFVAAMFVAFWRILKEWSK